MMLVSKLESDGDKTVTSSWFRKDPFVDFFGHHGASRIALGPCNSTWRRTTPPPLRLGWWMVSVTDVSESSYRTSTSKSAKLVAYVTYVGTYSRFAGWGSNFFWSSGCWASNKGPCYGVRELVQIKSCWQIMLEHFLLKSFISFIHLSGNAW